MAFGVVASPEDFAEAYLERFRRYVPKVMDFAPYFRLASADPEKVVVKSTAVGRRGRYEIYGTIRPLADEGALLVSVRPLFPMYLLALLSPVADFLYPTAVVVDQASGEAWAKLTFDRGAALAGLKEAAARHGLLEPSDFDPDTTGVSFEGYLHRTPAGYVAFASPVEWFELVDEIVEHEEDGAYGTDDRVFAVYDLMSSLLSLGLDALAPPEADSP